RPLALADLRVRVDLLECGAVDDRADVGVVLPPRPEPQLLHPLDKPRLELVVRALLDDHARRGRAALTRGAERRPENPVDGEIDVSVVENDDPVLAAELE